MGECSGSLCQQVAEKLLLFRDGELPEEEIQFVREHLQYCPPCVCILNGYEEVVDVLHRLQPINMPDGLLERMRKKMKDNLEMDEDCCD